MDRWCCTVNKTLPNQNHESNEIVKYLNFFFFLLFSLNFYLRNMIFFFFSQNIETEWSDFIYSWKCDSNKGKELYKQIFSSKEAKRIIVWISHSNQPTQIESQIVRVQEKKNTTRTSILISFWDIDNQRCKNNSERKKTYEILNYLLVSNSSSMATIK